jgi:hypothetical protein
MKALISTTEQFAHFWVSSWAKTAPTETTEPRWEPVYSSIEGCQRVAQVEADENIFEVCPSLFWFSCPDECQADTWYFKDGQCLVKPQDVPKPTEE